MKKLTTLAILLTSTLALSACNLNDATSNSSSANNSSNSQSLTSTLLNSALSSGVVGQGAKLLSKDNLSLLGQITEKAANNDFLMSLLKKVNLDGYVKNAAALQLATNALKDSNGSLASKALGFFSPKKADQTQSNTFNLLNQAANLFK